MQIEETKLSSLADGEYSSRDALNYRSNLNEMSKSKLNARTKFRFECSKRRKHFQFDVATPDIKANLRLAVRLSSPPMVCPMVGYLLDARALLQQAVRGSHSQAAAREEGARAGFGVAARRSPSRSTNGLPGCDDDANRTPEIGVRRRPPSQIHEEDQHHREQQ